MAIGTIAVAWFVGGLVILGRCMRKNAVMLGIAGLLSSWIAIAYWAGAFTPTEAEKTAFRRDADGNLVKVELEFATFWDLALTSIVISGCIIGLVETYRSRPRD